MVSIITHSRNEDCPEVVAGRWNHCLGHRTVSGGTPVMLEDIQSLVVALGHVASRNSDMALAKACAELTIIGSRPLPRVEVAKSIGEVTFDKRPDGTVQVTRYAANFGDAKFPVTCSLFLPEDK